MDLQGHNEGVREIVCVFIVCRREKLLMREATVISSARLYEKRERDEAEIATRGQVFNKSAQPAELNFYKVICELERVKQ